MDINSMKLSMGMIGLNMFNVQEKTWGHRFVEKSALDLAKWSSSADLGFGISKKINDKILLINRKTQTKGNHNFYTALPIKIFST